MGAARRSLTPAEIDDFEQELIDQWCLALAATGAVDSTVLQERAAIFEFARFVARHVWTALPQDADRWLGSLRQRGQAVSTVRGKAGSVARFFGFLDFRYQGDIHALTGVVVGQPIDEFNRPAKTDYGAGRVPPPSEDVERLFTGWRASLPEARKYLPAARDYVVASLWRRVGLRINETAMLDIRDWRPDLGPSGKLHVRFGKGSNGRGPKTRLVPGINATDALLSWWLTDVRHQFGDDWENPDAPLFPSERRDPDTGRCTRVGTEALRRGLASATVRWLPDWDGHLTPHGLRHYCASSLYEQGVGLKAIQELLGHSWLTTTTLYVHVSDDHIERSWNQANQRTTSRLIAVEE
nr:tyrosine-type recombinase/integrase [Sporichthya sp.]